MAVALRDSFVNSSFNATSVDFSSPVSSTTSETFTFTLNNSSDDILVVVDATQANPGNYTISFDKGGYPSAKAPVNIIVPDGFLKVIPIESGRIEKKNSTASFTVTASSGSINLTGIRFAVIKKRFVTNN